MRKFIQTFFFGLCTLLLVSCAKDEEVLTGTINGFVSDYTNANTPIAGATVTINSKGLTKTTGSDGRFEFLNLEPGTYSIAVSANNFQPTTKQITVYAGQIANCDFQMEKAGANVDITPVNLSFGEGIDQLSFTIKNNGNQALTYSISNTPDYIEVSPASGTVAAKSSQAVSVHVKERSSITSNRSGQLTVNVGNDSYIVSINISNNTNTDPNQGGGGGNNQGGGGSTSSIVVTRSLLAYYTFDDETANNAYRQSNNGNLVNSPKFVNNTPSGSGKALSLETKQYVDIPTNMLEEKTAFTINLWVKDFGTGVLFSTYGAYHYGNYGVGAPTIYITSDSKASLYYGYAYETTYEATMNYGISAYQSSGWHMITFTASSTEGNVLLYIDGTRVDTKTGDYIRSVGTKMQIGGNCENSFKTWADPAYIDNVRIYSVALNETEIKEIYNNKQ